MAKKKVNPRRKPATQADVKKAKEKATDDAIKLVVYMMLYALADKHGMSKEQIQQIGHDVNYIADSVSKGYISPKDIKTMIEEEHGFTWEQ